MTRRSGAALLPSCRLGCPRTLPASGLRGGALSGRWTMLPALTLHRGDSRRSLGALGLLRLRYQCTHGPRPAVMRRSPPSAGTSALPACSGAACHTARRARVEGFSGPPSPDPSRAGRLNVQCRASSATHGSPAPFSALWRCPVSHYGVRTMTLLSPPSTHKAMLDCVVVGTSLSSRLSCSCLCLCLLSRFACRAPLFSPFFVSLPSPLPSLLPAPSFPFLASSPPSFSLRLSPSFRLALLLFLFCFVPVRLRFSGSSSRLLLVVSAGAVGGSALLASACLFPAAASWSPRRSLSTEACVNLIRVLMG